MLTPSPPEQSKKPPLREAFCFVPDGNGGIRRLRRLAAPKPLRIAHLLARSASPARRGRATPADLGRNNSPVSSAMSNISDARSRR
jgi:hypothetical protein